MIVHTVRIPYKYGQTIKIRPIFDVHLGNAHCDERAFKAFLAEDDEAYFVGGGDLLDSIVTSDSKRYRKSSDATKGDAIIDEQIGHLVSILEPYKNRIFGLGTGNHEDTIVKHHSTDPTKRVCDKLGVKSLGYSWLMRIILTENGGRGRTIIIRGMHGYGGGSRTQGADLTKYSKEMAYWDADCFLYGHVHRKQADRVPRLGLIGDKLISKPKLLGICGTFLKTFSANTDPTYSECKGYPPVEIGGLTLNIKPDANMWCKLWIDT